MMMSRTCAGRRDQLTPEEDSIGDPDDVADDIDDDVPGDLWFCHAGHGIRASQGGPAWRENPPIPTTFF